MLTIANKKGKKPTVVSQTSTKAGSKKSTKYVCVTRNPNREPFSGRFTASSSSGNIPTNKKHGTSSPSSPSGAMASHNANHLNIGQIATNVGLSEQAFLAAIKYAITKEKEVKIKQEPPSPINTISKKVNTGKRAHEDPIAIEESELEVPAPPATKRPKVQSKLDRILSNLNVGEYCYTNTWLYVTNSRNLH